MTSKLYIGDCLDVLNTLDENSIDTCITDPPYGLGFMGKEWDTFDKSQFGIAGNEGENDLKVKKNFKVLPRYNNGAGLYDFTLQWATEVFRVLKPGGLLLAFGGTRTYHRLVCGIEDAGFEIRDTIGWIYGSGFPKSLDISKAIEKNSEAEKEAQLWNGWGTALKPAMELIVVAQKPLDGTYAENALKWGVAGYWIDGGRIATNPEVDDPRLGGNGEWHIAREQSKHTVSLPPKTMGSHEQGRFPSNFTHDGSDEVLELFPYSKSGAMKSYHRVGKTGSNGKMPNHGIYGEYAARPFLKDVNASEGSAARFFYCAKASRAERNAGLEDSEPKWIDETRKPNSIGGNNPRNRGARADMNFHPTVKPLKLMQYLVRLTKTPYGGIVLDPFMGSGTTGIACALEGRDFIGIEKESEYYEIAEKRINYALMQQRLL